MLGGNGFEVRDCPLCGEVMWNGWCENTNCEYNKNPLEDEDKEEIVKC